MNFKFERSLRVYNELRIAADGAGPPDAFTTDFKFSTKAALIVGMTNRGGAYLDDVLYDGGRGVKTFPMLWTNSKGGWPICFGKGIC